MEPLLIKRTDKSPDVLLDADAGKISFTGKAFPENAVGFFEPVIEWLTHYYMNPAPQTECYFKLEYFNSSSRKCFVDIFKILDSIHKKTQTVVIIWAYDEGDDAMKEIGEEYETLFKMRFKFVEE